MRTRSEVSAGGVVYRGGATAIEIALAARRTRRGDLVWGLAKGAIEPGESAESAAVREVLEETGLHADVEDDLGEIRYNYVWEGVRVRKTVHFFLMRTTGGDVRGSRRGDGRRALVPARRRRPDRRVQGRARGPGARRRAPDVTPAQAALGVVVGFLAGVLSGLFGVGGGIVTTPAVNVLLGGPRSRRSRRRFRSSCRRRSPAVWRTCAPVR